MVRKHEQRYRTNDRTIDSLKRKFASLYRKKMPTGDPAILPDVRSAKRIRSKMTDRADLGEGNEIEDTVNELFPDTAICAAKTFRTVLELETEEDNGTENKDSAVNEDENVSTDSQQNHTFSALRTPLPRPLVRKTVYRGPERNQVQAEDDLLAVLKMNIVEEKLARSGCS